MQLRFTHEEISYLAQILEQQASDLTAEYKAKAYALLDHVIARDLRFAVDELEDLQDILARYEFSFRKQAAEASPERMSLFKAQRLLLESLVDKVTEACAMV